MKGDFTRDTFKAEKHYEQVLMQQGRVQLDADWNEQAALTARRDITGTADIVGHCGGPADNAAFGVLSNTPGGQSPAGSGDFYLSAGRYYVDGIQCELEQPVLFSKQPDRFGVQGLSMGKSYLLYLDVWQRHITALEDGGIREPALGGPDTATRVKTVWQVRVIDISGEINPVSPCITPADTTFKDFLKPPSARIAARTAKAKTSTDPCEVPESAGYKGLENQLYRVEIHEQGNLNNATFKWSRENGSVVTLITDFVIAQDIVEVIVSSVGPDDHLGFRSGNLVELLDDSNELEGIPGVLATVDHVDPATRKIKLKAFDTARPLPTAVNKDLHAKLRRWEGIETVTTNKWLTLEYGVQIRFDNASVQCRTGEYWQIPARAATATAPAGDIEWPRQNGDPQYMTPRGIWHHYCKLGVVQVVDNGVTFTDCRCLYPALTSVPRMFYVSGDGQEVMPDLAQPDGPFKLPQPLIVGVANAQCLPEPLKVKFRVTVGSGRVPLQDGTLAQQTIKATDPMGLASCDFHLDATTSSQQVTAHLLDTNGNEVSLPIIFNANLSIASQVAYDPGSCAALQGQYTVQEAIQQLASLARLEAVGGDGQDAVSGEPLSKPIEVLVTSSCGPIAGANVHFDAEEDGTVATSLSGLSASAKTLDVATNQFGLATVYWKPDEKGESTQQLTATLTEPAGAPKGSPTELHFTANLRRGGSCCVTVGHGGDFQTIDAALEDILNSKSGDACLCLLPGNHEPQKPELFGEYSGNLRIVGCGRGSRLTLNKPAVFRNLTSFTMRDLEIYSSAALDKTNPAAIRLDSCEDITIVACNIAGKTTPDTALLAVHNADRVRLADNFFEAALPDSLKEMINVLTQLAQLSGKTLMGKPFAQLAERLKNLSRQTELADFNRVADEAGVELARLVMDNRDKMGKLMDTIVNTFVKESASTLSWGEKMAFLKFFNALRDGNTLGVMYARFLRDIRSARIKANAGVAVVLGDANSSPNGSHLTDLDEPNFWLLENNEISGIVSLAGQPDNQDNLIIIAKWAGNLVELLKKGTASIAGGASTLQLRGNKLTRITIGRAAMKEVISVIETRKGSIAGILSQCALTDNVIEGAGNLIACLQLSLMSNKFTLSAVPVADSGLMAGASIAFFNAVFVGNQSARRDVKWLDISGDKNNNKAANVGITFE